MIPIRHSRESLYVDHSPTLWNFSGSVMAFTQRPKILPGEIPRQTMGIFSNNTAGSLNNE